MVVMGTVEVLVLYNHVNVLKNRSILQHKSGNYGDIWWNRHESCRIVYMPVPKVTGRVRGTGAELRVPFITLSDEDAL